MQKYRPPDSPTDSRAEPRGQTEFKQQDRPDIHSQSRHTYRQTDIQIHRHTTDRHTNTIETRTPTLRTDSNSTTSISSDGHRRKTATVPMQHMHTNTPFHEGHQQQSRARARMQRSPRKSNQIKSNLLTRAPFGNPSYALIYACSRDTRPPFSTHSTVTSVSVTAFMFPIARSPVVTSTAASVHAACARPPHPHKPNEPGVRLQTKWPRPTRAPEATHAVPDAQPHTVAVEPSLQRALPWVGVGCWPAVGLAGPAVMKCHDGFLRSLLSSVGPAQNSDMPKRKEYPGGLAGGVGKSILSPGQGGYPRANALRRPVFSLVYVVNTPVRVGQCRL